MTPGEFQAWFNDYCLAFPETADYVNKLQNVKDTMEKWRVIFAAKRIDLAFGKQITEAMLAGDVPSVAAYEREKTPALIVAGGRELQRLRGDAYCSEADSFAQKAVRRNTAKYARPANVLSFVEMMEGYRTRINSGMSKKECDAWLDIRDAELFIYTRDSAKDTM